jgi:hypothetical protein
MNICRCHTSDIAWAVVPVEQLHDVGIELLYALYELAYINPLGLLEHIGKVLLLLLSSLFGNTVRRWKRMSPWAFPGHALKILEWISLHLLLDYLVLRVLGI